jgi:hypothetical protein
MAHSKGEADRPAGGASVHVAKGIARCASSFPIRRPVVSPSSTPTVCRRRTEGPPVFEDVSFDVGRRRPVAGARPQRCRQDQPVAHPRRRDHGQSRDVQLRAQRQRRLLRAGARQPARRRLVARQHSCRGPHRPDPHRDTSARSARG